MMKRTMLTMLTAAVAFAGGTLAGSAVAADETARDGNYVQSVLERAEAGDASAQFQAGVLHQRGEGVPKADLVAVAWYRRAAEQNHAWAQHNLGVMYEDGAVVSRDLDASLTWYLKAAGQGLPEAQFNAGRIYEFGDSRGDDDVAHAAAYRRTTQPAARPLLANGSEAADDPGDYPDRIRARLWYLLAADAGYAPARLALKRLSQSMAAWEAAEADRLAAEWRVARGG